LAARWKGFVDVDEGASGGGAEGVDSVEVELACCRNLKKGFFVSVLL
jgi:hypothetical protein